jgi:hypothetical protein
MFCASKVAIPPLTSELYPFEASTACLPPKFDRSSNQHIGLQTNSIHKIKTVYIIKSLLEYS